MKIVVLGTRGIPNIPGGIETHCQALYPRLAELGCDVTVITRRPYVESTRVTVWENIKLKHIFTPRKKMFEAIVHTFLGILYARRLSPDILHIHAVGPALLVPFAKLLGLRVVMTNHGPDYDREKWGKLATFMLKAGEKIGGRFANEVIVISQVIGEIVKKRCHRDSHLIYNGVAIPEITAQTSYLERLGVNPGNYILAVARFVPEKGLHDLVAAFTRSGMQCNLVIAGDSDHEDDYSRSLKESCAADPKIILTGYIGGDDLHQILSHARLFVLPSYHEGLPISLLEALSYGVTPLVSDIPANLEVGLSTEHYFRCKDIDNLGERMLALSKIDCGTAQKTTFREFVRNKYDWDKIARQTLAVYETAIAT